MCVASIRKTDSKLRVSNYQPISILSTEGEQNYEIP